MRSNKRRLRVVAVIATIAVTGCARARPVTPTPAPPPVIDPVQQLRSDFDNLIDQPGHQRGVWGIVIQSIERSDVLYERNPRTLLVPASTMKLVSMAAAAESVGWDYTFETRLLGTAPVVDGVLQGDLLVIGSGDPSVFGRAGEATLDPWIEALRQRGITRIDGRVVGDDDDVEEPKPGFGWSWEDLAYPYGASAGALNLAENKVNILVTPGNAEGLPTIVELPADARGIPIANHSATAPPGTTANLWPELRPGESALAIHGVIGVGAKTAIVSAAAANPTLWFARTLRNRLLAAGIDVSGEAVDVDDLVVKPGRGAATVLYVYRSNTLAEIARPLSKDSINVYAEAVLRLATGRDGVRTTDAALDAARARLKEWNIPEDGIQIVDGSGLSRRDVVAPETLVAILRRFYDASRASPWMQTLAVAGRDGTLASRMKGTPAEGNAIAKTGSMSNVRTIAGYVWTADDEPLAFAIMANNFEGSAAGVTATIDKLIVTMATFSRNGLRR
jgi:D-alanyl-D-alanine carboxypeptidase/D-alanyl-D-alanine-endopeptidase (penicillin-binding protein 4)